MVQTICSYMVSVGEKKIVLEKPLVLRRIFFSICRIQEQTSWYSASISFDDPLFSSFYVLNGSENKFWAKGADIFQGNIWVSNKSTADVEVSATEILH